jgi:hypothetical protein
LLHQVGDLFELNVKLWCQMLKKTKLMNWTEQDQYRFKWKVIVEKAKSVPEL